MLTIAHQHHLQLFTFTVSAFFQLKRLKTMSVPTENHFFIEHTKSERNEQQNFENLKSRKQR